MKIKKIEIEMKNINANEVVVLDQLSTRALSMREVYLNIFSHRFLGPNFKSV
jgi:hypothetical protein